MSEGLGDGNVRSCFSGTALAEAREGGWRGEMVGDSESKTLAESSIDNVELIEGVRVSDDSRATGEIVQGGFESGCTETSDTHDGSKSRVVQMMSRNDGWGSWGVMNLVGKVLDGKFCMDKEVEDVKNSSNETNVWQGATRTPLLTNGIYVEGTETDKDSDKGVEDVNNFADQPEVKMHPQNPLLQSVIGNPSSTNVIALEGTASGKGSGMEFEDVDIFADGQDVKMHSHANILPSATVEPLSMNVIDIEGIASGKGSDNEVEDVKNSANEPDVQKHFNMDAMWCVIGELSSTNVIGVKETASNNDSEKEKEDLKHLGNEHEVKIHSTMNVSQGMIGDLLFTSGVEIEEIVSVDDSGKEIEDVKDFEDEPEVKMQPTMTVSQGMIGELLSTGGVEIEETISVKDSGKEVEDVKYFEDEPTIISQGLIGDLLSTSGVEIKETESVKDSSKEADVKDFEDEPEVKMQPTMNVSQGLIGDLLSTSGVEIEETASVKDSGKEVEDVKDFEDEAEVKMQSKVNLSQGIGDLLSTNEVEIEETSVKDSGKEVEDVNDFEDEPEVKMQPTIDVSQGMIGDLLSINGVEIEETVSVKDSDGSRVGVNENHLVALNEITLDWKMETEEVNDPKVPVLTSKENGEHRTGKEGEYRMSEMVWGKVRTHPWWPGEIFEPSGAAEEVQDYFKEDCYLIAYYGDQTFAWNDRSTIKPFREHFYEMEKQTDTEIFCRAVDCSLDEVARRVELGLSCPCLPKEVTADANIQDQSTRVGIDCISGGAGSFSPEELVQFLESLARYPLCKTDRLQFSVSKAQVLALNRWKGHSELPELEECGRFLEDRSQPTLERKSEDSISSNKRKSIAQDASSSRKRKHFGDEQYPEVKDKCHSSSRQNYEGEDLNMTGMKAISAGKRRKTIRSEPSNYKLRRHSSPLLPGPNVDTTSNTVGKRIYRFLKSGEESSKGAKRTGEIGTLTRVRDGKSHKSEIVPSEIPTPDVILSKLLLAAKNPMQEHERTISIVDLLCEFRKFTCTSTSTPGSSNQETRKLKRKQPDNLETAGISGFTGCEDSFWTNRIIQSSSQDQVRTAEIPCADAVLNLDNGKEREPVTVDDIAAEFSDVNAVLDNVKERTVDDIAAEFFETNAVLDNGKEREPVTVDATAAEFSDTNAVLDLDIKKERESVIVDEKAAHFSYADEELNFEREPVIEEDRASEFPDTNDSVLNVETKPVIVDLDPEKSSFTDDVTEEHFPTTLILNFSNLESIPSIVRLNQIFRHYGPLRETETEILNKSKRAKVIFKRREDADSAFSSAGKYSLFGPSLVSYRLNYAPPPRKVPKRRRKESSKKMDAR